MSSDFPRRCSRHELAAAPDGQCILCRRESSAVVLETARERSASALPWLVGALLVLGVGGAAAWSVLGSRRQDPQPIAAVVPVPVRPEAKAARVEKTDAERLTESLRMLERAEQDRLAAERSLKQSEQEQRTAAEAQRKRAEQQQDLKRHQAVTRELDAVALASARRNVSITMYSTSWCGVCKKARAYMETQHIAFTELDVDHNPSARAQAHALNPRGSVPTIAVDDEVLIGFSPDSLENRITRAAKRRTGS